MITASMHTCMIISATQKKASTSIDNCSLVRKALLTAVLSPSLRCSEVIGLINEYAESQWKEQSFDFGNSISSIAVSPNKKNIALGTIDGFVLLVNPKTFESIYSFNTLSKDKVKILEFSPDSTLLVSANLGGSRRKGLTESVKIWNTGTKKIERDLQGFSGHPSQIKFLNNDTLLLKTEKLPTYVSETYRSNTYSPYSITVLDIKSDTPLQKIPIDYFVATVFKTKQLVACMYDIEKYRNSITIWNADTFEYERTTETCESINSMAASPDNTKLAIGTYDDSPMQKKYHNLIKIIDLDTGKTVKKLYAPKILKKEESIISLLYSPSGDLLASGTNWRKILLWNPRTSQLLGQFENIDSSIMPLAFSPEGGHLILNSEKGTLKITDVSEYIGMQKKIKKKKNTCCIS